VDAFQPGSYGGTGELADWNAVRRAVDELSDLPVILAGGLTPDNVAAAIVTARPAGVDAASGVESQPGVKDPARVRVFVQRALQALLEDVAHFAVLAEKPPA
jgi:phosphoribosylanthranilate isomerase